jgi:membrane protein YqaA with SNARE-associated domain
VILVGKIASPELKSTTSEQLNNNTLCSSMAIAFSSSILFSSASDLFLFSFLLCDRLR